jgi:hypothetical protein
MNRNYILIGKLNFSCSLIQQEDPNILKYDSGSGKSLIVARRSF